ncbi:hypothetical protein V1505DRAFT_13104 [Lipomyces doorenjongii]
MNRMPDVILILVSIYSETFTSGQIMSTANAFLVERDGGSNILVNGGPVPIPPRLPLCSTSLKLSSSDSNSGGKLGITDEWITWASERILWLPPIGSRLQKSSYSTVGTSPL